MMSMSMPSLHDLLKPGKVPSGTMPPNSLMNSGMFLYRNTHKLFCCCIIVQMLRKMPLSIKAPWPSWQGASLVRKRSWVRVPLEPNFFAELFWSTAVPNIPASAEMESDEDEPSPLSTAPSEDNLKMDEAGEEPILATTFTDATRFKILKDSRVRTWLIMRCCNWQMQIVPLISILVANDTVVLIYHDGSVQICLKPHANL